MLLIRFAALENSRMLTAITRCCAVGALAIFALSPVLAQRAPTTRIRGTITSVDGANMTIKSRTGHDYPVRVSDKVAVVGLVKFSLADIKTGDFIGAAAEPQSDGSQKALEIHVFPESMRGTGEGFRPFDLKPNSTMTNATVTESAISSDGKTLTLKYKDGEKKLIVSPDTPVVTFVPGDKSELKAGAKIIATAVKQADDSWEVTRVSVGRDGLTPPM
jgi:hypothetical protein